jgi:hypothetical protein
MPGRRRRRPALPIASAAPRAYQPRRLRAAGLLAVALATGCATREPDTPFVVIDLLRWFRSAEARPAHGRFELAQHTFGADARAILLVPVPSRVVWQARIPRRAILHVAPGVAPSSAPGSVRFRIGVSDDRIYESLAEMTMGPRAVGPQPIAVDLSAYAGRKWSLFYRPEERPWRLVLSADHVGGSVTEALWVEPRIEAAAGDARRFRARLRGERVPAVTAAF